MFPAFEQAKAEQGSDYAALPEAIRFVVTEQEFLWLSDAEKARLIQNECEPEW